MKLYTTIIIISITLLIILSACTEEQPTCGDGICDSSEKESCALDCAEPECIVDTDCTTTVNECRHNVCDDGQCVIEQSPDCGNECKIDADCDDKNTCTTDSCVKGNCLNNLNCEQDNICCESCSDDPDCYECTEDNDCSGALELCEEKVCINHECTIQTIQDCTDECTQDVDCDDNNACTTDRCEAGLCINSMNCEADNICCDECSTDVDCYECIRNSDCDGETDECEENVCINHECTVQYIDGCNDECDVDADCDDNDETTIDYCRGTPKACEYVNRCVPDDNSCPGVCTVEEDPDCPAWHDPALLAYWPFETIIGPGLRTPSLTGVHTLLIANGALPYQEGYIDNGITLDGENDIMNVGFSYEYPEGLTIIMWVKPQAAQQGNILSNGRGTTREDFNYGISITEDLHLEFWVVTSSGLKTVTSSTPLTLDTWAHVAVEYSGSELRLYVNGNQVASSSWSGDIPYEEGVGNILTIGARNTGTTHEHHFAGMVDEVYMYERVLSVQEIQDNYALN
ncbi:LamG domain-containing protein [Candidatus Woesearchaeota archaeon]|nr:LamG domain-containing protein [Candidatus Woesearchaeota archaeon]